MTTFQTNTEWRRLPVTLLVVFAISAALFSQDSKLQPDASASHLWGEGRLPMRQDLLRIAAARREIEVSLAQAESIAEIHSREVLDFVKAEKVARRIPLGADGLSISERLLELTRSSRLDSERAIGDVLLPHQVKRLDLLVIHAQISKVGIAGVLTDKWSASPVHLEGEEASRFSKRAEEISDNLERRIRELRDQAAEELLKELPESQRSQLIDVLRTETPFLNRKLR